MADVKDNPERSRFEIFVDGQRIGLMTYYVVGDTVVTPHTEIEPRHRGQGYARQLVRGALDQIRADGKYVEPQCPFVRAFIEQRPEYQDLVKEH